MHKLTLTALALTPSGVMADARVRVECAGLCWVETAVYFAPLGQAAPAIKNVAMVCVE